jgi:hypothetical protein
VNIRAVRFRRTVRSGWRRVRGTMRGGPHSCLDCGYLCDRDGGEISPSDRARIAAERQAGWFQPEAPFACAKGLWEWELGSPVEVTIFEANRSRPFCDGFYRWVPGRDAEAHLKLEDENRIFTHQSRLAWRSFFGGLIGAAIGQTVASWFR